MLCPLLSRHQSDPATGKGEWIHQECLGAQCKFYNVPEADCQFLLSSRSGSVTLPTAVTGEDLEASAALGATAGREIAARLETALREALERLEIAQREVVERINSAQKDGMKRLQSAGDEAEARLRRVEDSLTRMKERQGEIAAALERLEQQPGPGKEMERVLEAVRGLGERQSKATESLERLEKAAAEEEQGSEKGESERRRLDERLQALEEGEKEALHTLQAMREAVTSLPSRHGALAERLESNLEEVLKAQTEAVGSRLAEELKAAGSEQARQVQALGEDALRNHGRLSQELKKIEHVQEEALSGLRPQIETLSAAAADSKQALQAVSGALGEVRSAIEREPAEFQALGKQVKDLHLFTRDALDAARQRAEGLWSQVETVGRSIGQLALIVKGLQGEVERANNALGAVRTENKSLLLAFHEQKTAQQEEQRHRNTEQARELNNKGVALFHRGSIEAAIEAFIRAVELRPEYAEAYNNLGLAYSRRGQSEEAVRYFQKALEIDPQMGEVYNNLGFLFHTSARYDRAVEMFTRSLQTGADQSIAYTNLGNTFYKMRQNDKAIAAWKKALEIDPLNESARRGMAMFQQEPAGPAAAKA